MGVAVEFFDTLLGVEIGLWNRLERAVQATHGVSLGRLQALQVVARQTAGARVNDVSRALRITVGAASKLVDRLETDGLVLRAPNPGDRRSSLISLTASGATVVESASRTFERALIGSLPPDLVTGSGLVEVTAALARVLEHIEGPAPR